MAVLTAQLTFPHAPITSLQKRMVKGVEQLYYAKLFLTTSAYDNAAMWRRWREQGFHVATFDPPPGTVRSDRLRVRLRAPTPTPTVSATSDNVDALKQLRALLEQVDALRPELARKTPAERNEIIGRSELNRVLLAPLAARLAAHNLTDEEIRDFGEMLRRGINALTDDDVSAISISV